jgi:YYY domain-containing protein
MDYTPVLIWYFTILIFGLAGWTLAFPLLRHLPDRGFAFARPVGLLFTGYLLWIGGTFHLLQNSSSGILICLMIVLVGGLLWQNQQSKIQNRQPTIDNPKSAIQNPKSKIPMLAWLKREWRYALSAELLFNVAFISWVIFKSYNPNIETAGGEKWMEITFINGTLRSAYFPPQDPWLSGFAISYYYFGYVLMAMITKLTGIVSTTAFNLYIPTLFAMTLTAAFGIIANMVSLHQTGLPEEQTRSLSYEPVEQTSSLLLERASITTGWIAALFIGLMGNLVGVFELLHKRGLLPADFWIWLDIRDLKEPPIGLSDSWIPDRFMWWWRGSRVLTDYNLAGHEQEVIDEFPFFSFLLGDVHPHVLALPFVLLVVALALNLLANMTKQTNQLQSPIIIDEQNAIGRFDRIIQNSWQELLTSTGGRLPFLLYGIAIGALSFLNTWDFPIYLSVIGFTLIAGLSIQQKNWQEAIIPGLISASMLTVVSVILYLPFYATFRSQAGGILPNLWNPTRLPQFFVFFGPFLVAIFGLLIALSGRQKRWPVHTLWTMPLTIIGPVLILLLIVATVLLNSAVNDYVQNNLNNPEVQQVIGGNNLEALLKISFWRRVTDPWTFLLLGVLLGWGAALLVSFSEIAPPVSPPMGGTEGGAIPPMGTEVSISKSEELAPVVWLSSTRDSSSNLVALTEKFSLILLVVGILLPLTVEFIFLKDNFGYRMNTIFKFYFQAWVLMALVSAFAVYYVLNQANRLFAITWSLVMVVLVAGAMVYPILAIADKTNYFNNEQTLNGIGWVANHRPGDYAAIEWLRNNAPPDAVVLEAPGSGRVAYQYVGRVSALTGVPTLLGWGGHQSQWRGNYDEPARREPDIEQLFNTVDPQQTQHLLEQYNITYVYVGPLERERYAPTGLNKFEYIMDIAFQEGDVTIYQRR